MIGQPGKSAGRLRQPANCLESRIIGKFPPAGAGNLPIIPFHGNSNGAANDRVYPI
jgi:hypothetical protein